MGWGDGGRSGPFTCSPCPYIHTYVCAAPSPNSNGVVSDLVTLFNYPVDAYLQVKLSWIFLGISLLASAAVMPISRFSPPK